MYNKIVFETIDSTNTYAKNNIDILNHLDVLIAKYQSAGRGKEDHTWLASYDKNILMTIILKEPLNLATLHQLSQVAAISIVNTLAKYNIEAKIKFPNDIMVGDKKISGILIESIFQTDLKGVVVGIGLNVYEEHLLETATSMNQLGFEQDKEEVLDTLLEEFYNTYTMYKNGLYDRVLDKVNSISYLYGKEYKGKKIGYLFNDGTIELKDENHTEYMMINDFSMHTKSEG